MGSKKHRNPPKAPQLASRDTVLIGYVHGDRVHPRWVMSERLVGVRDKLTGQNRIVGVLASGASGAHVATGRCRIVRDFLDHPLKPDWLWMVDTDATFEPHILDLLLASADPVERPVVGALAFGFKQGTDGTVTGLGAGPVEVFPTLYLFDHEQEKAFRIWNYPENAMVPVDGTGAHCLLVHRSVLEHPIWDTSHPLPWFRSGTTWRAGEISEDLFFCMGVRAAGFPIFVNTAAKTGHIKEIVVDESMYQAQRAARSEAGAEVSAPADLDVAEIVLVVPSRGRPQQAGELAECWRRTTTGRSRLWVCIDNDDDAQAYADALGEGVHLLVGPRQQMCPWTNQAAAAVVMGGARVVASLGDDHRLVGDWESQVLDAVDDMGGTTIVYGADGIQNEKLPTAAFVTADIVAALGWMCLPGLQHLYCDNVWKVLGEAAGVLRYVPELSTPHLHPCAGLAEMDASYAESNSQDSYDRDGAVFRAWLESGQVKADASRVAALRKVAT